MPRHNQYTPNNNTITVLNVAEKPSVARALQSVFGRMPGAVDRGMQRMNQTVQVFTHENVQFPSVFQQGNGIMMQGPNASHTMITTSVRGHLATQDFPKEQYGWSSCAPVALFDAPIITYYTPDMQPLEQTLTQLSRNVQVVILWLDCDREGEAIGDEVKQVCLASNPRLNILRAKFSTVLPQEIQRALCTLGRLNQGFVDAVQARSQLDLRVGAAFTRFQTLRLQKKFDGFQNGQPISYGPCQFPTLGFVVERWARIETFVPEDFWFIELTLQLPAAGGNQIASTAAAAPSTMRPIHFTWKRTRLYDRLLCMVLYEQCLDAVEAVVTDLTGRPKNKWRPVPLATVELQKRASKYLRLGSETLMSAAEELYQQGYISYPRTETERFRPEFQHRPLIQDLAGVGGELGAYAQKLLTENHFQNPRQGQHDDNAHPPITPCKAVDPSSIGDSTQRGVYTLIVKHYLACCSRDALGKETLMTVRMGSEEFTAKGLMILERNWLEIYSPWERWSTGQGELPHVEVGSRVTPSSLLMKDGRTTPPQPISEVELISIMDRNGIGTDATIAQHISTIQQREYAVKDNNQKFHPTKLGIALVEGYNSMGYQLNKPDLRREMEAECNQVALGRKSKEDIMAPILAKMKQCFERVNAEARKLDEAVARHYSRLGRNNDASTVLQHAFSECGTCQNLMMLKQPVGGGGNGGNRNFRRKLLYCATCQIGHALPGGNVRPKTTNDNGGAPVKCPICQFQVIRVERGDGYEGNGYEACPKCFSDPPMEYGGASNPEFRCFSCQHPTCELAGGAQGTSVEVFACPFCNTRSQGKAYLRKNRNTGSFTVSCDKYKEPHRCQFTIWLPREASSVSAVPEGQAGSVCNACSRPNSIVRKLHFVWKPGSFPPHVERECTACVLCDVAFREEFNVRLPTQGQVRTNPGRRGGRAVAPIQPANRGGRGAAAAGGGNACFVCGQAGHFANQCPRRT